MQLVEDGRVVVRESRVADVVLQSQLPSRRLVVRKNVVLDRRQHPYDTTEVVIRRRRQVEAQPGRQVLTDRLDLEHRTAVAALDGREGGRVVEIEIALIVGVLHGQTRLPVLRDAIGVHVAPCLERPIRLLAICPAVDGRLQHPVMPGILLG